MNKIMQWNVTAIGCVLQVIFVTFALTGPAEAETVSESDRATRFLRLTQVNPLYAWPGVDLDHMGVAIEALAASRSEILTQAKSQYGPEQLKRIDRLLYPTAFLSEMRVLEGLRRALTIESGEEGFAAYQDQLNKTIERHQAYLASLIAGLQQTAAEAGLEGLEFHFGQSRFEHFIDGVLTYQVEASSRLQQANMRWACYQGQGSDCEMAQWPTRPAPTDAALSTDPFETPVARITRTLRENGPLKGAAIGPGWALLDRSRCHAEQIPAPYFLWRFPTSSGVPAFRSEGLLDIMVHDHRPEIETNAYVRILDTLGMDGFLLQSQSNLYACPDAASDTARLRSMVSLFEFADAFDWGASVEVVDDLSTAYHAVSRAADHLVQTQAIQAADTGKLAILITNLLNGFERPQLITHLGAQRVQALEEALLSYRMQTPYLEEGIMNLIYGNTAIADYVPYAPWDFIEELLFTRNAPALLLGGTNPSIIAKEVAQIETLREGISPRLRGYVQDLARAHSEGEFIQILLKGLKAEQRLARFQSRPYLFGN